MVTRSSLEDTFAVFEDPYNLAKITPGWVNFSVTSPRVEMRKNAEIEYTLRWLGIPLRWKTTILEYEPPFSFVDKQTRGPYKLWLHKHTFHPTTDGTRVGDQVEYALPFGPLGSLAHALLVRRQLLKIFEYRQKQLSSMFGEETIQTVTPRISGSFST
jgi:hypothetical protein